MSKTYTIYDHQGLLHDGLRKILNDNNWHEVPVNDAKNVDFAWVGATIGRDYLKYDKCIYDITTQLKNILVGGGVKGDIDNKDVITNKEELYKNMMKTNHEICDKHLMPTFNLQQITHIEKDAIFIVRPIGCGAGGGAGVMVVSNNNELYSAKKKTNRYKSAIITKYITTPLLFRQKKFHLRMYFMVCMDTTFRWSLFHRGKIITAEYPYVEDHFNNPKIHDTHFKSTSANCYFPEDLELTDEQNSCVFDQMYRILEATSIIIKPHAKSYVESKYAFEVFGCDFMITNDLVVKLIEINARHDYGVDDLKKNNPDGFKKFCDQFYNWVYTEAIKPVFN
jgi:hypothetical protein